MSGASVVFDYWKKRIAQDLNPFADPGTDLHIEGEGRSIGAEWVCRGTERQARFSISPEQGVQVSFLGRNLSYRSFLVGPEMADLLGLAKMILQSQKPLLFIPTKANLVTELERPPESAVDLINAVLDKADGNATKIVMVTGEAGAGKTRVLQEVVRKQAIAYQNGQATTLHLYVNAQGRALARLSEALATELQDLRAMLTYHAVAAIVRLGALVPVIDGFDELIGVSGYDDAFSSLTRFIEELDGQGQIVASARSTYYEEEFVSRATAVSSLGGQIWTQIPIRVRAWGEDEFTSYIKQKVAESSHDGEDETVNVVGQLQQVFSGTNAELRQKPLFVSRAVDLTLSGVDLTGEDDLLNELVDAYLERERTEKLLDRNGSPLLSKEQITHLLESLAEEMWNQETRELDWRSVRDVAEYVLVVDGIEEATQRIVVERMPTLAFLAPGDRQGSITFEHELFFSLFLARVFGRSIAREGTGVRALLSRSILPPELADISIRQIGELCSSEGIGITQMVLEKMAEAGRPEGVRAAQVRENGGRLTAAVLRWASREEAPLNGAKVGNVVFPGGDLANVHLINARFDNVCFRRTDLTEAVITQSIANDVMLQEVTVDPKRTRLELRGIDPGLHVHGLRILGQSPTETIYDPDEIVKALVSCGTIAPPITPIPKRKVSERRLRLLERFMRAYNKANPVCTSDDHLRSVFRDADWATLQKLLIDHGIVTAEVRHTGGQPKTFLRRQVLPSEFMAGARKDANVPVQVRQFWDTAEKLGVK